MCYRSVTDGDRRPTDGALVDRLAATLQARVLRGEIPSGARLRQEMLAAEFERQPHAGARGAAQASGGRASSSWCRTAAQSSAVPTAREIREAYEVRAELEGFAAELAAERIQERQLARLHDAQRLSSGCSIDELTRASPWRRRRTPRRDRGLDPRQRRLPPRDPRGGRQRAAASHTRRPPPHLPARPDLDRARRELAAARGERRAARRDPRGDRAARPGRLRAGRWSTTCTPRERWSLCGSSSVQATVAPIRPQGRSGTSSCRARGASRRGP